MLLALQKKEIIDQPMLDNPLHACVINILVQ